MNELDEKISKFKELSKKAKTPQKQSKLTLIVTFLLISLLVIQAVNFYTQQFT